MPGCGLREAENGSLFENLIEDKKFRPLARPICNYSGLECPLSFWQQNMLFVTVGVAVGLVLLMIAVAIITYLIKLDCLSHKMTIMFRSRQERKERQRSEWQISSSRLLKPVKVGHCQPPGEQKEI